MGNNRFNYISVFSKHYILLAKYAQININKPLSLSLSFRLSLCSFL